MKHTRTAPVLPLGLAFGLSLLGLLTSCSDSLVEAEVHARPLAPKAAGLGFAPLTLQGTAYEAAGEIELPEVEPREEPGLHHVFRLSDTITSGAEPQGPQALERIASWGVKTVLSVDGKVPDAETAEALGMRYVHVPIEYAGMRADEVTKIAKTFRELEGPFYVHCFHGQHRGPAAAAIGRIVLDGVPRERAIAEMRQWCSTASKYEGLYSSVATSHIPTAEETADYDFGFEAAHSFDGLRGAMIGMTRKFDLVKASRKRTWALDPQHPDVVPLQEALQLQGIYEQCAGLDEVRAWPDDFREWLEDGRVASGELVTVLEGLAPEGTAAASAARTRALAAADAAYGRVKQSCSACHAAYRN